ncbi:uncharacterized protein CDAR_104531 [Caerostris darwini]|uniref:Uncharacterized protein n=1 Tax=Caerostris darwini TaxID=1538125 RepID=A0AAV4PR83_9ARAC|nr:uncharacterized protein CDAR_104531 [Caerostris darwini]
MKLRSLYDMCHSQIIANMRAGFWNRCKENPFKKVPPVIVHNFAELIFSMDFKQLPNHETLYLLFTSRRPKKLDLSCFSVPASLTYDGNDPYTPSHLKREIDILEALREPMGERYVLYYFRRVTSIHQRTKKHMEDECNSFLYMLSKHALPHLKSFVMTEEMKLSKFALQPLIQASTNLTEIHTCLHWFDLNVLMNYKKLRVLRLHFPPRSYFEDCPEELLETCGRVLPTLDLKIFTICNSETDCFGMHPLTAIALAHCPRLTSVGPLDSAMAIDYIKTKSRTSYFKLKKCFWGVDASKESSYRWDALRNLGSRFPKLIKTAVSCCPSVEELILQVVNKDCLQHLRRLERLKSLCLDYEYCDDFDIDECLSSLGEIKHQLKHFILREATQVNANRRFPLNVITDSCENLETLAVRQFSVINMPLETNASFRRLKRISILTELDYLSQILRYCDNLTDLILLGPFPIDESEFYETLGQISVLKLQTFGMYAHYFSSDAMRMLLSKAPNLGRICVKMTLEPFSLFLQFCDIVEYDFDLFDELYFPTEFQKCVF